MRGCRLAACLLDRVRLLAMELRDLKMQFALRLLRFVSYVVCVGALGVGLYVRWVRSEQSAWILGVAFVTLSLFLIAVALRYYFLFVAAEEALSGVSLTFLVGFIALTSADGRPRDGDDGDGTEQTMNYMLVGCAVIQLLYVVVGKVGTAVGVHTDEDASVRHVSTLLPARCRWIVVGMLLAILCTKGGGGATPVACLATLLAGLVVHLCAVRLGSRLGVLLLGVHLGVADVWLLPLLDVQANSCVLAYFVVDLFLESLVDLVVFGSDEPARWRPLMGGGGAASKHALRAALLVALLVQAAYAALAATTLPAHKEWYIVTPMYAVVVALLWGPFRIALLVTCWQLVNRLSDCSVEYQRFRGDSSGNDEGSGRLATASSSTGSLADVMAAKGVRHFALVCTRVAAVALVTSALPLLVAWTTVASTPLSVAFFLLVLPYESAAFSLLRALGDKLGGTCCGYAAIGSPAPAMYRQGESVTLLSPAEAEKMASRSGAILGLVHKFFAHNLIDNASGCDCSTGVLTADYMAAKLQEFFSRTSPEGRCFDTYVLYYSGPVHPSGDWALAGNSEFKYEDLMRLWHESAAAHGTSRVVVVLDTLRSNAWLPLVTRTSDACVGLQTATLGLDPETSPCSSSVGDFTRDWVNFNCGMDETIYGDTFVSPIIVTYAVSKAWTSFKFGTPTRDEIGRHWDASFPKVMQPLRLVVNFPSLGRLTCCCSAVWSWLLRCKMSLFQPARLDTGHGFKLVRFARMR